MSGNQLLGDVLQPLSVTVALEKVRCIDKGIDGVLNPKREPYLWALFFKMDAASIELDENLKLTGTVTTHAAAGSHESLGSKVKVKDGDVVAIPARVGRWQTSLLPFELPPILGGGSGDGGLIPPIGGDGGLLDDLADDDGDILGIPGTGGLGGLLPLSAKRAGRAATAVKAPANVRAKTQTKPSATPRLSLPLPIAPAVGVIFALMEHDLTSEKVAEAGHKAFNDTLTRELNRVVAEIGSGGLTLNNPQLTPEQQRVIAKRVEAAVIAAVRKRIGFFQAIANLINKDDVIGSDGVVFSLLDLLTGTKRIDKTFRTTNKTGTWQITGTVKGVL